MVVLNCMSTPVCLVGIALPVAGLVANPDRSHRLTWIGLVVNGVVIVGILCLYLFGAAYG
jgi:hypothetical protein